MESTDSIQKLRRSIQYYENAFVELAIEAQRPEEVESFDLLAMELHDLDRSLYESIFIRNNSKIQKLINEIRESTVAAERILHQFKQVKDALAHVRKALQQTATYLDSAPAGAMPGTKPTSNSNELLRRANELMNEVDELFYIVTTIDY